MFGRKPKKEILNPDYQLVVDTFVGNIYNIESDYHGSLAWKQLTALEFVGIAKEFLPKSARIIFHRDENYHDLHIFSFVKDRVEFFCEIKKWLQVELTEQEKVNIELGKIMKKIDDAYAKYKKNPNWHNARYVDGLLDITEKLVRNLERITNERRRPETNQEVPKRR
jgi:hypothetical protein